MPLAEPMKIRFRQFEYNTLNTLYLLITYYGRGECVFTYVCMSVALTFKTKKLDKTRFPVWAETFDFPLDPQISVQPQPCHPIGSPLILTVFDKDFMEDDFMGEVVIPYSEINSMETAHGRWYSLLPRTRDRIEKVTKLN